MTLTPHKAQTRSDPAEAGSYQLASPMSWKDMRPSEHLVQFYETDDFLLDAVGDFIGAGLGSGAACILFATQAHREEISHRLQINGLDPSYAQAQGKYFALDATETLSQFLVEGSPDPQRFAQVVGGLIERAVKGRRRVRIFGEMVALLWEQGNQMAGLRLEALWNELRSTTHPFSLLCAYPMSLFIGPEHAERFSRMCELHSRIIPDESYTRIASQDERLRAVSRLQQKALSLDAEIAERQAAEERLRISENRYRRLFEASTDGIVIVDPHSGLITDANPSLLRLLGSTHEQIVDQELWLLPDQPTPQAFLRQIQQDRSLQYEMLELATTDSDSCKCCCSSCIS